MHAFATLLIIIGVVLVVVFSNHGDRNYDVAQLRGRFVKKPFLVLCATVFVAVVGILMRTAKQGIEGLGPLSCAFLSSVCGSFSVLLTKCSAQLIKECTLGNDQVFLKPTTYAILAGTVGLGIASVYFLNIALNSKANALYVIPVFYVMTLSGQVSTGSVYFGDFADRVHRARLPHLRRTGALRRWRRNAWVGGSRERPARGAWRRN